MWSAVLRFRRGERDWDVVLVRNGQNVQIERFATCDKAEAWADKKCVEIAMGWKQ
jgi:hypothetical protein